MLFSLHEINISILLAVNSVSVDDRVTTLATLTQRGSYIFSLAALAASRIIEKLYPSQNRKDLSFTAFHILLLHDLKTKIN